MPLAYHHVVHFLEVDADGVADLIASDAHGFTQHGSAKAQHRHLGGAAADVDDHRADRLGNGKARADGRRHWLVNQVHLAGTSHAGFTHGTTLNASDATGDAHNQTREPRCRGPRCLW